MPQGHPAVHFYAKPAFCRSCDIPAKNSSRQTSCRRLLPVEGFCSGSLGNIGENISALCPDFHYLKKGSHLFYNIKKWHRNCNGLCRESKHFSPVFHQH